jgi:hypothetical protein
MLLALCLIWFSGAAGWVTRQALLHALESRQGRYYRIDTVGMRLVPDPKTGVVVRVSNERLKRLAREALGAKALAIPPGTIPAWFTVSGSVKVLLDDDAAEVWLPAVFRIRSETPKPHVAVRLPSRMVNKALEYEGSFTQREKRKKYAFGHYALIQSMRFDTVSMNSTASTRGNESVTFRRIEGQATGQVRFRVKDGFLTARTTARVRRMELRCDLDFQKYVDGIALKYKITIPELDADINNLAPIFEKKPVEMIRVALEDSLGRPRKLEKLSRRRLPLYLPLDTELDVEVFD